MLSKSKAVLHKATPRKYDKREAVIEPLKSSRVVALYIKVTDFGRDADNKPLFNNDVD